MSSPRTPELGPTAQRGFLGNVPWYLWPNLFSLDAVAVSLVWLWCFSVSERVPILPATYVILGLVVWLVYTADRLLDALRMKDPDLSTPRHRFARAFMRPLGVACLIVLGVVTYLVLFKLQAVLIYHGLVISMMVLLYFVLRLSRKGDLHVLLPKEIFCGIVFALGTTYPVHALPNNFVAGVLTAELGLFALLCALNCTAISVWEWREDQANDDGSSIVQNWPSIRSNYVRFAFLLAVVAAWLGLRGGANFFAPILLSFALSAALIGASGLADGVLSKDLKRALADVALLSPLVIVPLLG
ncbi:MAG: hypothetical protein ACR2RV_16600 [Verrucomicrobiales bacterium]